MLRHHRMQVPHNYHSIMVAEVVLRLPPAACRSGASQHHHETMEELWRSHES